MQEDLKKFDARYPLQGEIAGPALDELVEGGYACHIYYQDLPQYAPDRDERFLFCKNTACLLRTTLNNTWRYLRRATHIYEDRLAGS